MVTKKADVYSRDSYRGLRLDTTIHIELHSFFLLFPRLIPPLLSSFLNLCLLSPYLVTAPLLYLFTDHLLSPPPPSSSFLLLSYYIMSYHIISYRRLVYHIIFFFCLKRFLPVKIILFEEFHQNFKMKNKSN